MVPELKKSSYLSVCILRRYLSAGADVQAEPDACILAGTTFASISNVGVNSKVNCSDLYLLDTVSTVAANLNRRLFYWPLS